MNQTDVMEDRDRQARLALTLAWRTLRGSVARGRPLSLPNLLRLHRRLSPPRAARTTAAGEAALRQAYVLAQPFSRPLPVSPPRVSGHAGNRSG